mmetsp:Transcript_50647/g.156781  ORF Transcript_50647/g.156781 Transcript_50647/m.156781 type:complete len:239 (+) Transcript_50647:94-810(+)
MVDVLVLALHSDLFRVVSSYSGVHYQGLGVAARRLYREKTIDLPTKRKHLALAAAYNVSRHITAVSWRDLLDKFKASLAMHAVDSDREHHCHQHAPQPDLQPEPVAAGPVPPCAGTEPPSVVSDASAVLHCRPLRGPMVLGLQLATPPTLPSRTAARTADGVTGIKRALSAMAQDLQQLAAGTADLSTARRRRVRFSHDMVTESFVPVGTLRRRTRGRRRSPCPGQATQDVEESMAAA